MLVANEPLDEPITGIFADSGSRDATRVKSISSMHMMDSSILLAEHCQGYWSIVGWHHSIYSNIKC